MLDLFDSVLRLQYAPSICFLQQLPNFSPWNRQVQKSSLFLSGKSSKEILKSLREEKVKFLILRSIIKEFQRWWQVYWSGPKTSAFNGLGRSVCQLSDQSDFCPPEVNINSEIDKELILEPEIKGVGEKLIMKNGSFNRTLPLLTPAMLPNRGSVQKILIIFRRKSGHLQVRSFFNPQDKSIWGILQTRACAKPHKSLKSIQSPVVKVWQRMPQKELRDSVGQFRQRLTTMVRKRAGYNE